MQLLNRAVYEAWYFNKNQSRDKQTDQKCAPSDKYKSNRPRVPVTRSRSQRVKMCVDEEDGAVVCRWLSDKLSERKRCSRRRQQAAEQLREQQQRQQTEQKEVAAAAFSAWKKMKDELIQNEKTKQKLALQKRREEKEARQLQKLDDAEKAFSAFARDVDDKRRQQRVAERSSHVQRDVTTRRLLADRERRATAQFESWLMSLPPPPAATASASATRVARCHQTPWYPAGSGASLFYRPGSAAEGPAAATDCTDSVLWRPPSAAVGGGRGRGCRPCGQPGCCLCPFVAETEWVSGGAGGGGRVRAAGCCTSRRALYVLQCCRCGVQSVSVTAPGHSLRRELLPRLRRVMAGTAQHDRWHRHLQQHVKHHQHQQQQHDQEEEQEEDTGSGGVEQLVESGSRPLPLLVYPVHSFSESLSSSAVQRHCQRLRDLLGTCTPHGLNSPPPC